MMPRLFRSLTLATAMACAQPGWAQPTHLMIRALSQDAKFIGDHTGGVEVTVRNAANGTVLAQGTIHGGTGDTDRIMTAPRARGTMLSDAGTAGLDAVIDIDRPTLVEVVARGPMVQPATARTVRTTVWVTPGQPVIGDGLVLNFAGLLVTPTLTRSADGGTQLQARVTMLCGCPITPGGLWDEANYRVEADVIDHGRVVRHLRLHYAGQPSQFAVDLPASPGSGSVLRIVATQSTAPNTGVAEIPLP